LAELLSNALKVEVLINNNSKDATPDLALVIISTGSERLGMGKEELEVILATGAKDIPNKILLILLYSDLVPRVTFPILESSSINGQRASTLAFHYTLRTGLTTTEYNRNSLLQLEKK